MKVVVKCTKFWAPQNFAPRL